MTLLAAVTVLSGLAASGSAPLVWPLDLPRELSSSFAEYRPGRFHAGIDLRTAGTGREVRAAGDGYVFRVRCSPWGYGRAIYLQLDSGYTAVYAHLQDYDDALTEYVRAAQHAKESYSVDLYPEAKRFRVTAGQVIALSGQTGIGAPHLHFEIRDKDQQPVQPRALGLAWPDDTPPRLLRLLIAPRGENGRVDGDLLPVTRALRRTGTGAYRCEPVRVAGEIGFGVDFYDPASGGLKLGARQLELVAGGETRFLVRHDTLSYANHSNAAVAYHPFFRSEGRYLLLWRWPGNVCASYARNTGDGWLDSTGVAEALIHVSDSAGNTSTITIPLLPVLPPVEAASATATEGAAGMTCLGNGLLFGVRFDAAESAVPELVETRAQRVDGKAAVPSGRPFVRTGASSFRARWDAKRPGRYTFSVEHPRVSPFAKTVHVFMRGATDSASEAGVDISVPANAPYGTLFFQVATLENFSASLEKAGPAYRIGPEDSPIDAAVRLSFPIPPGYENEPRLRVYRRSGSFWSVQTTRRAEGRASIRTKSFGDFALLIDTDAPLLANVMPAEGYHASTRRPYIRADVTDAGSGITKVEARCDGEWLLCAYDPERRRMEWMRDEELAPGEHEITLRAWDEVGNVVTVKRTVYIPE